jgi:uncharacterized protein YbjT (DUF2867 family)
MEAGEDTIRSGLRVVLLGGSGMVGQGVLRECLEDPQVATVLSIVRAETGQRHSKLREQVHTDFLDWSALEGELRRQDACFWCLGVSSAGMKEADYTRVTYDYTMAFATLYARIRPDATFVFVSGQGTDATERGRSMWARVKGRTENALLALPFRAYMFRPGAIQPLHGIRSRTPLYNAAYSVLGPLLPVIRHWAPTAVSTTQEIGVAMLRAATLGAPKRVLETADILALGRAGG